MTMTTDTSNLGEITITRIFGATPKVVFECMTTPEHLTHFWGPTGVSTPVANIIVEPRVGGRYETTMVNDESGDEFTMHGVFVEFDPPHRLAWSEADVEGGVLNTVTFTDLGDGRTEAVIHQTNVPEMYRTAEAQAGMASSFDKLDAYLITLAPPR
jgi:uncharacterized protein YndB with AHSA1/START domain